MAMNERGKSDRPVVPKKFPNEGRGAPRLEEGMEGRGLAKGNLSQQTRRRTQCRLDLQQALERVRQAACTDKGLKLTALWHHVYNVTRLREAYFSLKRNSAPGVDGQTWQQYGADLERNLADLSGRLQRGAYRAKPVRRVFIPKADGRERPIGVPTLEDKLVQRAAAEVMGTVFETEFKGFSYGFRPGRSAHNALDALVVGIKMKKVNWILDADIRGFFDTIDHDWLMKFVEHRIADQRVLRHVKKWLNAGVLEDGIRTQATVGTPQGGSISPLLANIYLHFVFDDWAESWRRKRTQGDVIVVRYADDFVVGFEHRHEAEQFLEELRARFRKFNLELHPEKTRLLEFGRFAATNRERRNEGHPETFDFLGFTHSCATSRNGGFQVLRQTMRKRLRTKLQAVKAELRERLHHSIPEVGRWLNAVVCGHYAYYAVPNNQAATQAFRNQVLCLWHRALQRRSQKSTTTWRRMYLLATRWLPHTRVHHPWPEQRLCVIT
jgi:group II intron reverse transcriptase/maturase